MSGVVRAVRQQRGITLDILAADTGLTKSYLSKVERGQSMPSIAAALKIAKALDVDVAQLFSDDPEITTITVGRAAHRPVERHIPLVEKMLGKAMSPFLAHPGRQFIAHPEPTHAGQEFIFVHEGEVELDYDGDVVELGTGDCVYFDSSAPHRLRRVGGEQATVVVVTHQQRS